MHAKWLQSCLTLCDPADRSPTGSSVHGFSRQKYWSGLPRPPPGALPHPGTEPCTLPWQVGSLPLAPPVVYMPLTVTPFVPGIFPTQGSNPCLLHCRQILYQSSHQGSLWILEWVAYLFSGDLPDSGIEPGSPALQEDSLPTELPRKSKEPSHIWPMRPYTLHAVPLNMSSHFLTTFLFFQHKSFHIHLTLSLP